MPPDDDAIVPAIKQALRLRFNRGILVSPSTRVARSRAFGSASEGRLGLP